MPTSVTIWTVMKNERGKIMKRILAVALVLCLLPMIACAKTLDDFSTYAVNLGADKLDPANEESAKNVRRYTQNGCVILFGLSGNDIVSAYIDGDGKDFLAYCAAALVCFDPNGKAIENNGWLLYAYLTAENAEDYGFGMTSNDMLFFMAYENGQYSFAIEK